MQINAGTGITLTNGNALINCITNCSIVVYNCIITVILNKRTKFTHYYRHMYVINVCITNRRIHTPMSTFLHRTVKTSVYTEAKTDYRFSLREKKTWITVNGSTFETVHRTNTDNIGATSKSSFFYHLCCKHKKHLTVILAVYPQFTNQL